MSRVCHGGTVEHVKSSSSERTSSGGASRALLAEWQRRAFTVLREHAELVTIVDDEMPEEAWRALDEMRVTLPQSSMSQVPGVRSARSL